MREVDKGKKQAIKFPIINIDDEISYLHCEILDKNEKNKNTR